jgi:biopolymer transport protein TolR
MEQTPELIHGTHDTQPISDINVTPFIDVMLVLLIIFMITAPLMMGGVRINLPKTSGAPMERPNNPLIVSLDAENRIYVDSEEIDPLAFKEKFKTLALESTTGEVFVKGDGDVRYAKMMELMNELGQAGFARVMLVSNVKQAPLDSEASESDASDSNASERSSRDRSSRTLGPQDPDSKPDGPLPRDQQLSVQQQLSSQQQSAPAVTTPAAPL